MAVIALAALLGLVGCGGGSTSEGSSGAGNTVDTVTGQRVVSTVKGPLTVRTEPSESAAEVEKLPVTTTLGSRRVLLAEEITEGWVKVTLPTRPDGRVGWVSTKDIKLEPVTSRIDVDLKARKLTLTQDGKKVVTTDAAVGPEKYPTPTGKFYVVDRIESKDASGGYGPFALGLSVHSSTLSHYGGGDAQIGVHGTDKPETIGLALTHGCIRVSNEVASKLSSVPLGTPVVIV
jgi:lipoprotein-anchoring transpeptidase ErfK/SrfK